VSSSILEGLGFALRWLRDRQGRKQFQVANAAGITKGMLSSYETGRQRPSLDTLEKILDSLGCDLNDLHNALQIVNGRPEGMRRKPDSAVPTLSGGAAAEGAPGAALGGGHRDLHEILGVAGPIASEIEASLGQMLEGFHRFLRHLFVTYQQASEA
jgi:transcriptional regulator with XRE-family HTH domain